MQLLVQNCLDLFRATEIFSVPKRQIFALQKLYATEIKVDYSIRMQFMLNLSLVMEKLRFLFEGGF